MSQTSYCVWNDLLLAVWYSAVKCCVSTSLVFDSSMKHTVCTSVNAHACFTNESSKRLICIIRSSLNAGGWKPPLEQSAAWRHLSSNADCSSEPPQNLSFPDHFLPNCFRFLVLYTVYSSGLAVLYSSHSK